MDEQSTTETFIRRWVEIEDRSHLVPEIDEIFFEASATKSFASEADRAAFRERWLGRYLAHYPEEAFVALAPGGTIAGYLVGSLDDPASTPLFSDIAYFADLAQLTARYPAQLHVNLAQPWRGRGIGSRLVAAFVDHAHSAGVPGVHAVTGRGMRNVGFYLSNGFGEAGSVRTRDRDLVFLARSLVD